MELWCVVRAELRSLGAGGALIAGCGRSLHRWVRTEPYPPGLAGFFADPLNQLCGKLWVILLDQMVNRFLFN